VNRVYLNNFARTAQSFASSNFRSAKVRSGLPGLRSTDPRPRSHLWRSRHPSIACHGHSGQAYRTGFTFAEWLCRTADRVDTPRVLGLYRRFRRGPSAPNPPMLRALLQRRYERVRRHVRVCLRIGHGVRGPVVAGVIVAVDESAAVGSEPIRTSCWLPGIGSPLMSSTVSRRILLRSRCSSPCRSARLLAISWCLTLYQGPGPAPCSATRTAATRIHRGSRHI
jgi:hypothetical protein